MDGEKRLAYRTEIYLLCWYMPLNKIKNLWGFIQQITIFDMLNNYIARIDTHLFIKLVIGISMWKFFENEIIMIFNKNFKHGCYSFTLNSAYVTNFQNVLKKILSAQCEYIRKEQTSYDKATVIKSIPT